MERRELNAQKRETGKVVSKKVRKEGNIPGILYGVGREPQAVVVNEREVDQVVSTDAGWNILLDLNVDGKEKVLTRISDYQADVLKRNIIHLDFQALDLKKIVKAEVPIRLIGTASGVKEGGILEQIRRILDVRCLPTDIPGHIDIDVTELEIGGNIHIDDISIPEGVECLHETNFSIATIVEPTVIIAPEVAPAEGEEVPEGEEAALAEGEAAPAEGEAAPAEGEAKKAEGEAKEGEKKK